MNGETQHSSSDLSDHRPAGMTLRLTRARTRTFPAILVRCHSQCSQIRQQAFRSLERLCIRFFEPGETRDVIDAARFQRQHNF
jgi:hypothetical protein